MKVVILAGGFGTRIREESYLRPKPMIGIGGQPIIWHIMKYYSAFGFNEFIICCGYKGYMLKEYFSDYYLYRSNVTFDFTARGRMTIHENVAEPWRVTLVDTGLKTQTGGRLKRIRQYVGDETFMMTYGDGLSNVNLNDLLESHRASEKTVTLTGVQPGGRFGVLDLDETGLNVRGFREKAKETGGWINGGFMVMEPETFNYLSESENCILEREPMERLAAGGKLGVYKHDGFWQCMDTQRDRSRLEDIWSGGAAPWKIWEGGKV